MIIFDCGEGDNSPIQAICWYDKRDKLQLVKTTNAGFNTFVDDYLGERINILDKEKVELIQGDILKEDCGIVAHSISADWKLDGGIAKDYVFNIKKKRQQMVKISSNFFVYNLTTKDLYHEEPQYNRVFNELKVLFTTARTVGLPVKLPCIECGSGRLDWDVIYHMLAYLSSYYNVPVTVIDKTLNNIMQETKKESSNIEATETLLANLEDGGTAIIRMSGVNSRTLVVVQRLIKGFRKIACWRSPTTPNTSPEWYLIMTYYKATSTVETSLGTTNQALQQ